MTTMPSRALRLLAAPLLPLLVAACGSGSGDGGVDDRCFKIAQVAGWSIHVTSSYLDHTTVDTFTVALRSDVNATGTAGPAIKSHTNANAYAWYAKTPTGTISGLDSLSGIAAADSMVGTVIGFGPGPTSGYGPYLSVNLATCQATLGAIIFSRVTIARHGSPTVTDTILAAFPFAPGLTIDSLAVANGFTVASGKVPALMPAAPFGTTGEYRIGGLAALYSISDTATLDSATVSWTATPVASLTSATPAPPGVMMLENGAIVLPRRR